MRKLKRSQKEFALAIQNCLKEIRRVAKCENESFYHKIDDRIVIEACNRHNVQEELVRRIAGLKNR